MIGLDRPATKEMKDSVQVWQIPLLVSESTSERYFSCLSEDERARAKRYRFADDRRRFIVARGALRHLLSPQLAQLPQHVEFCYGEFGKPSIRADIKPQSDRSGTCDFHFNISHSGELALCVLSHRKAVGIDIEKLKSIHHLNGMISRCLSDREEARVKAEDGAHQTYDFLRYWTCKEAYLKAIGVGLTQSMQSVEVELCPLRFIGVPTDCEGGWSLHSVEVPEGYVAALVVAGHSEVELKQWQHNI